MSFVKSKALGHRLTSPRWSRNIQTIANLKKRNLPVDVHPEVEAALNEHRPVVALETALVTHGVPFPKNAELAKSLEGIVRSTGSIPATIGIIHGRVKIGLEESQLDFLSDAKANPAVKVSRRDIAAAIVTKSHAGTTCAATMALAALSGIKVFATGGLGGVHRGGENSMDISADLGELARCPVGLVSAGVKSILDIERTLEYLETLGVPVISYSKTKDFPAFFSPRSGFQSPWNLDSPELAAQLLHAQQQMGMQSGALFACPIPEQYEASGSAIQLAVDQAVAESEANGISKQGKAATPWLLARVNELTQGKSLENNIALLETTAKIGGQIAVEYAKIAQDSGYVDVSPPSLNSTPLISELGSAQKPNDVGLLVVGCAAIDITARTASHADATLGTHSTTPGSVSLTLGGVGRNIAEAAHRLAPSRTKLISAAGNDSLGRLLVSELGDTGMPTDGIFQTNGRTAVCNMHLDSEGHLMGGVADMDIIASLDVDSAISHILECNPRIVALDGNLQPELIRRVINVCNDNIIEVFYEPTSVTKSTTIFRALEPSTNDGIKPSSMPQISISPNLLELDHMYQNARVDESRPQWEKKCALYMQAHNQELLQCAETNKSFASILQTGAIPRALSLLRHFHRIIVKCGELGALVVVRTAAADRWSTHDNSGAIVGPFGFDQTVILRHFPAIPTNQLINVTGAGDSFVGALLGVMVEHSNLFNDPDLLAHGIQIAQQAAVLTLSSHLAVSPKISELRTLI